MAGSIKDTSTRTGLSWDVCKNIHKRYLQSTISFSLGSSEYLAIDEFSIKKGHKYGTVVADIVTKRVIWVCEGKSNTEVSRFDFFTLNDHAFHALGSFNFFERINHFTT